VSEQPEDGGQGNAGVVVFDLEWPGRPEGVQDPRSRHQQKVGGRKGLGPQHAMTAHQSLEKPVLNYQ